MKVSMVVKIARQYEGEAIFIQPLQAFFDKENLKNYMKGVTFQPAEVIDGVQCVVEVGILQDVEVGDFEQFYNKEA